MNKYVKKILYHPNILLYPFNNKHLNGVILSITLEIILFIIDFIIMSLGYNNLNIGIIIILINFIIALLIMIIIYTTANYSYDEVK